MDSEYVPGVDVHDRLDVRSPQLAACSRNTDRQPTRSNKSVANHTAESISFSILWRGQH
jgi:hypothetical protein